MAKGKGNCNIILLVCDTLRADRLSCMGYFRKTSPVFDRMASEGALFKRHYTSGISTGNAFSCILSGQPSIKHKYYVTPAAKANMLTFDDLMPTLAEIIKWNTDYTTVATDNLINFAGHMKQAVRGFDYYLNPNSSSAFLHPEYTAAEANDKFLKWLTHYGNDNKFFAFIHWWDTHHAPYRCCEYGDKYVNTFDQPDNSFEGLPVKRAAAGYDYVPAWGRRDDLYWSISYMDRYQSDGGIGEAIRATKEDGLSQDMYDHSVLFMNDQLQCIVDKLKEIGQLDNTVIIVTADHGEGLGAHGIWGHGEIYDNVMHIPLILWGPGIIPSNRQIEEFTQHVDLAPTVLDIAGVRMEGLECGLGAYKYKLNTVGYTIPVEFEGNALLPVAEGKKGTERDFVVAEMRRSPKEPGVRAIFDGEWKLLARPTDEPIELYNLKDDPMEKVNIIDRYPEKRDELLQKLKEWKKAHIGEGVADPMIEVYKPFEVK